MNLSIITKGCNQNDQQTNTMSENDLQKLINICNSYGLNEQQTNQLVSQFKRGALYNSNQSFNDSLNESLNEMTFSYKQHDQQYSFKHLKQPFRTDLYHPDSIEERQYQEKTKIKTPQEQSVSPMQTLEKLLQQKFCIEKSLITNLQEQNQNLKKSLQEKDIKIQQLHQIRTQDSNVIVGLKDIISNLTLTLREKETSFRQIQDKYNQLIENKIKQLSQRRSMTQFIDSELNDITNITNNGQRRDSRIKMSGGQSKQSIEQQQSRETRVSNNSMQMGNQLKKSKQSRIDIKRYKEMIENMRNNY